MSNYPYEKKPAFFPFTSAEVFFEAEASAEGILVSDVDLDAELNELLGLNFSETKSSVEEPALAASRA